MTQSDAIVGHEHEHHGAAQRGLGMVFALGVALNLGFVLVEAAYGVIGHSVALLADAGHNLGDVLGLAIAWGASVLARRRPSHRYTYGLRSSSILAALFNAIVLLIALGGIAVEAINRLSAPQPVATGTLMVVAAIGIVVNGVTALLLRRGRHRHHDLNIRAAFLHMVADAGVSLGVVPTGALILATGWLWLDPAASRRVPVLIVAGRLPRARAPPHKARRRLPRG